MRTPLLLSAAVLAAAAHLHAAQDHKKTDDGPVIVVTGCVDGGWLRVQGNDQIGNYAERYKLRGSKQLLKELAQYKGHVIEVTGPVTDTANTTHAGKTVQVGKKTRIRTGDKEVPQVPQADDPSIDVHSYRNISDSCR